MRRLVIVHVLVHVGITFLSSEVVGIPVRKEDAFSVTLVSSCRLERRYGTSAMWNDRRNCELRLSGRSVV